jgi:hypothetical protein
MVQDLLIPVLVGCAAYIVIRATLVVGDWLNSFRR